MYHTIVVGAGVAGLIAANMLEQQGKSVLLLEARERIGGRILGVPAAGYADLGATWVWPEINPRLTAWMEKLRLPLFEQPAEGERLVQFSQHEVRRYTHSFVQYPLSMRLAGGTTRLVEALHAGLTNIPIRLQTGVTAIRHLPQGGVLLDVESPEGVSSLQAEAVILTLPPRLLAEHLRWDPQLPAAISTGWQGSPTWMAGQAKCVVGYSTAFWREAGLSGHAASQVGPLVEIHDASDPSVNSSALFGFVGGSAEWRSKLGKDRLIEACLQQLKGLFGPKAATPEWIYLQDWAEEQNTAASADSESMMEHPSPQSRRLPEPWAGVVYLAGTEFADDFTGYLEGAVRSAEQAVAEWLARYGTASKK